jgi:hypothetical protein
MLFEIPLTLQSFRGVVYAGQRSVGAPSRSTASLRSLQSHLIHLAALGPRATLPVHVRAEVVPFLKKNITWQSFAAFEVLGIAWTIGVISGRSGE